MVALLQAVVLTLTVTCADDAMLWAPSAYATKLVYGGTSVVLPIGTSSTLIGCWEGTIRVTHVLDGQESEPVFFWWEMTPGTLAVGEDATGRFMEWDFPCPLGDLGECIKYGRSGNCRRYKPVCPTVGAS